LHRRIEFSATSIGAWSYPIILVGWFHGIWLAAWVALGRRPVPSWDDPRRISIFVDCVYWVPGVLLVAFPLAIALGVVVIARRASTSTRPLLAGLSMSALFAAMWIGAISFLRWDPLKVVAWYMD
jgi:hypothetical protein